MDIKTHYKFDSDYGHADFTVFIDGEKKYNVWDSDSPEDNNIGRNFSDSVEVVKLMKLAYEAGKNGEEFNEEHTEEGL